MRKISGLEFILLVDDDAASNFLHQRAIKKAELDVKVQVTQNGQEGLDFLTGKGKFANATALPEAGLVFLDINMPGMNGWEFLEHYKELPEEQLAGIKLLLLTTSLDPDDEKRANNILEVKGFINKPLTAEKLNKIIKTYVF